MKIEFTKKIEKNEFKVICDKDYILNQIEQERNSYEENYYQPYYSVGYEDGYLLKEKYNENLDDIIRHLDKLTTEESMNNFIEVAKKKKNGTFYNNRVIKRIGCDNTVFITEWHNTWIYNALTVKAIGDLTIRISYEKVTDTPA